MFFAKSGDMFEFSKYGPLYQPLEWASFKLLSFSKDELAATMLTWTDVPIHNSLTQLDSRHNKLAKTVFKNVMGYMGERQYNYPVLLAKEILQICLENEGIRDEVYCQVHKYLI